MTPRRAALAALLGLSAAGAPELAYWAGARGCPRPEAGAACGVLVLGFPSRRDGSPHPMQRHRVRTAVETLERAGCGVMVLSGGSPGGGAAEAEVMAGLAREAGIPEEALVLERESRDTWENVRNSLGALEGLDRVYVVSDALHAHRGARYLCRQSPVLCPRSVPAARYRPGELYLLKWWGAAHEAGAALRDWRRHGLRPWGAGPR